MQGWAVLPLNLSAALPTIYTARCTKILHMLLLHRMPCYPSDSPIMYFAKLLAVLKGPSKPFTDFKFANDPSKFQLAENSEGFFAICNTAIGGKTFNRHCVGESAWPKVRCFGVLVRWSGGGWPLIRA
eukprot:scaffold169174_cov20-Prasinocladus_malaysianus.AAC.1